MTRRVQLCGEQRRESDRSGANDRNCIARFDVAIQHAALVRRRQDVAEQDDRLEIKTGRQWV